MEGVAVSRAGLIRWVGVAVAAIVVAVFAQRVFADGTWWLTIGAAIPLLLWFPARRLAGLVGTQRRWRRLIPVVFAAGSTIATAIIVVVSVGGSIGDLGRVPIDGPRGLLSTEWPSPATPLLLTTMATAVAVAVVATLVLIGVERFRFVATLPLAMVAVATVVLSAPSRPSWVAVAVVAAAVAMVAVGDVVAAAPSTRSVVMERTAAVMAVAPIAVAALATVLLPVLDRTDPRYAEPVRMTDTMLLPLEAIGGLRLTDPAFDLYSVEQSTGGVSRYWRLGVLTEYDGNTWKPETELRPIGPVLSIDSPGDPIAATVTFLSDDTRLVPVPGTPVRAAGKLETDETRSVVRLAARPSVGDSLIVEAVPFPTRAGMQGAAVSPRSVSDNDVGTFDQATDLVGDEGSLFDQLVRLETLMRTEWRLDADTPGAGQQAVLLERFVDETQRGTREQFVAGFALMARELGAQTRIATGFDSTLADGADDVGDATLGSATLAAWPEVHVAGIGWIVFDPVPPEEAGNDEISPPVPQTQTPLAPQPPVAPPAEAEQVDDAEQTPEPNAEAAGPGWTVAAKSAAAVAGAGLLVCLAFAAILLAKWWRWRRRRRSVDVVARLRGYWAEATDRLVDAGLQIAPSATNREIVTAARRFAPTAEAQLAELASQASRATFALTLPPATDDDLQRLEALLPDLEAAVLAGRSPWWRLRWRLRLRSFRRATRSPVDA